MINPSYEQLSYWMLCAWKLAQRSQDPSTQLGAVLIGANGDFIGEGFNHFPAGTPESYWHDRDKKYPRVIHAEQSAYLNHAKYSSMCQLDARESTLVCPWACCVSCAGFIVSSGTRRLVVNQRCIERSPDRWKSSTEEGWDLLTKNGIEIVRWEMPEDFDKPVTVFDGKEW